VAPTLARSRRLDPICPRKWAARSRDCPYTASASASYNFVGGKWKGLSLSGGWNYVGYFTAQYEDAQRQRLNCPGYGMAWAGASYSKKRGKFTHGVGVNVRNLFDYDFEAKQVRLGSERECLANYRLSY